jgi:hypothetical protein
MVERQCPSCGSDPGTGSFCQHCGTPLTQANGADALEAPPATSPPTSAPPQSAAPQSPPRRRGLRSGCLIAGAIVLALVAGGAFFVWRFVSNEILPGIQETADQFTALSEAPPGPCFDLEIEDGYLTGWDEVSCSGPRQVEVSFGASFEEGPWPGDEYLTSTAANTCLAAFETYVGVTPEQSAYEADWLLPTEAQWAEGVRKGICLVVADDGSALTGTVKGSEA